MTPCPSTDLDLCGVLVGRLGGVDSQHVGDAAGDQQLHILAGVFAEVIVGDVFGQWEVLLVRAVILYHRLVRVCQSL